MENTEQINPVMSHDAKTIIDMLYDTGCFRDSITRDDMNIAEELTAYLLNTRFEGYKKMHKVMQGFEKRKE